MRTSKRKVCISCGEDKPVEEYSVKNKHYLNSKCKSCVKEYYKLHYIKNKEKHKQNQREWKKNNKERKRELDNKYSKTDKGRAAQEKGRNKYKEQRSNKRRQRRSEDVLYDLQCRISKSLQKQMKAKNFKNNKHYNDVLGCTMKVFCKYIESQFSDGMSWDNRSEWHLDHIIPKSLASTEEDIYKLNHYTNFQPLWAKDNMNKGAKVPVGYQQKLTL